MKMDTVNSLEELSTSTNELRMRHITLSCKMPTLCIDTDRITKIEDTNYSVHVSSYMFEMKKQLLDPAIKQRHDKRTFFTTI